MRHATGIVCISDDILIAIFYCGKRRQLSKLELTSRRFHFIIQRWFSTRPYLAFNLDCHIFTRKHHHRHMRIISSTGIEPEDDEKVAGLILLSENNNSPGTFFVAPIMLETPPAYVRFNDLHVNLLSNLKDYSNEKPNKPFHQRFTEIHLPVLQRFGKAMKGCLVTTAGCSLTFQFASAPPALNPNAFPDSNSVLLFLNAKILPLLGPSLLRLVVWGQFQHEDAGTDFFVRLLSLPAVLETNSIKLNLLSVGGTSATFSLADTPIVHWLHHQNSLAVHNQKLNERSLSIRTDTRSFKLAQLDKLEECLKTEFVLSTAPCDYIFELSSNPSDFDLQAVTLQNSNQRLENEFTDEEIFIEREEKISHYKWVEVSFSAIRKRRGRKRVESSE